MIKKFTFMATCFLMAAMAANVIYAAIPATLTFDELSFQSVDGLSYQGVTFGYTLEGTPSFDAYYHSYGPGNLATIQEPCLTGNSAGILTLDFDVPTPVLQFGVALNTGAPLSPGYTVELFDITLNSIGVTPVDTSPTTGALGFSEAGFFHSGMPVSRAIIDFADDPGSFAFDNLTYIPIPEPSTLFIAILGAFILVPLNIKR